MNKELDDDIMDGWLTKLKEAKERFDEKKKNLTPKIQRIPHFLKQNDRFAKYCTPKLISFGPIHHKDPHLKQGEEFKLLWTSNFVIEYSQKMNKDVKQVTNDLCKNIKDDIKELKELFAEDALLEEGYDDNYFTWMLFVDGCSALYFMENVDMHHPEALNIKLDQLMYISRDIYLLENQLPMRLLKLISESGEGNLNSSLFNFHTMGRYKGEGLTIIDIDAIHILDHIRLLMIEVPMEENTIPNQDDNLGNVIQNASDYQTSIYTYKNIRDLKAVGIGVKPCTMSTNPMAWSNVHFSSNCFRGELRLPSAEDVKELRLSGTLVNMLGSDEDLANFINELGDDLPTKLSDIFHTRSVAFSTKFINVKQQIEKHYSTKWRRWLAQGYKTYFGSPWSIIAFLAALVALILTFIQTWFTIHPKH